MSNSLQSHGLGPTRLLRPWDFQAKILEWVAISFSRRSSQPRDRTQVSHIVGRHFTISATREVCCGFPCGLVGFPSGSAGEESACNEGNLGLTPGLGRSSGERKGYPLQYSGLENSMDCIVHGVAKSRIKLSNQHLNTWLNLSYFKQNIKDHFISILPLSLNPFKAKYCHQLLVCTATWFPPHSSQCFAKVDYTQVIKVPYGFSLPLHGL